MKLVSLLFAMACLTGCTLSTSQLSPVGRSTTTGGVVCPSGYESTRNGACVPTPNASNNSDAFR